MAEHDVPPNTSETGIEIYLGGSRGLHDEPLVARPAPGNFMKIPLATVVRHALRNNIDPKTAALYFQMPAIPDTQPAILSAQIDILNTSKLVPHDSNEFLLLGDDRVLINKNKQEVIVDGYRMKLP